ncbi:ribbon-helix-helix protein, CopG family [Halobacteria archaeon AArc-curdl1]|uniref:Ribbon-helix-helix protein, CopG family n=1 Tax=Natronosalvus hydrolyticus TaxID=2979988 RepID=A0AAP3E5C6_9EURY|nr:ribbon-helix-helix protein, CopG family [Halobacteria archaeon AArc-curdl1]
MRTSLNVPDETLDAFDAVWQSQGISSRSRAVREAMQEYIESHQTLDEMAGTVAAVIVFDYSYDAVVQDIHEIQHAYEHLVNSSSHVHHGNWCLETVHCTGDPEQISELVYRLRDFDAVKRVKLMVVDGTDSGHSIVDNESAHDH